MDSVIRQNVHDILCDVWNRYDSADEAFEKLEDIFPALHQQEQAEPVGYWSPSADLDEIAFSYSNQGAYKIPLYRYPPSAIPEGWKLVEKKTCFALLRGNDVIATLAGPDAEENAATIAALLEAAPQTKGTGE